MDTLLTVFSVAMLFAIWRVIRGQNLKTISNAIANKPYQVDQVNQPDQPQNF